MMACRPRGRAQPHSAARWCRARCFSRYSLQAGQGAGREGGALAIQSQEEGPQQALASSPSRHSLGDGHPIPHRHPSRTHQPTSTHPPTHPAAVKASCTPSTATSSIEM